MSPKRQKMLTDTISNSSGEKSDKTKLATLSQTRWVERYSALESTVHLLPYIGQALQAMKDDDNYRSDWDGCATMLRGMMSFQFIYTLYICCQIMGATKELCVKLQGRGIDVASAGALISGTKQQLQSFRSDADTFCSDWYNGVKQLAEELNVSPDVGNRLKDLMLKPLHQRLILPGQSPFHF